MTAFACRTVYHSRHKASDRRQINDKKRTYLWTIGITLLVGARSSFLTRNDMSCYTELVNKPMLTPSAWIFPVVWTILYVLMGIGLGRVLESDSSQADKQSAIRCGLSQSDDLSAQSMIHPKKMHPVQIPAGCVFICSEKEGHGLRMTKLVSVIPWRTTCCSVSVR